MKQKNYDEVDATKLTAADALNDKNYGKAPLDVLDYAPLNLNFLKMLSRAKPQDTKLAIKAICDFIQGGELPNESEFDPMVYPFLEEQLKSIEKSIDHNYVRKYRLFVNGKKNHNQDKKKDGSDSK